MSMTVPLWTSDDAAAATGGRATVPFTVDGVSIDTRTLKPGDLFVALKAARAPHLGSFSTMSVRPCARGSSLPVMRWLDAA